MNELQQIKQSVWIAREAVQKAQAAYARLAAKQMSKEEAYALLAAALEQLKAQGQEFMLIARRMS